MPLAKRLSASSAGGNMISRETLFEMLDNSKKLPKLSSGISEILAMLKNPSEVDIDLLAQKVSEYGQLNELVINNFNSGFYGTNRKIISIREAVVYLGMHTVQNLIIFFITRELFSNVPRENKTRSFDMPQYWRHIIGTSAASVMLSSRIRQGDKYKLFSYGLLHDIGIALLDACLPDLMDDVSAKVTNGVHQLAAERLVMGGLTHSDIGAWLCRKWNIRDDITTVVEYHHTPSLDKTDSIDLKIIHVADMFSTMYYEKLLGLTVNPVFNSKIIDSLGVSDHDKTAIIESLPQEVEKLHNIFTV